MQNIELFILSWMPNRNKSCSDFQAHIRPKCLKWGFPVIGSHPLWQTMGTIEGQWWRDRRGRRECAAGSTFPGSPLPQRHFRASLRGSHTYVGFAWNRLWWDLPAAKVLGHNIFTTGRQCGGWERASIQKQGVIFLLLCLLVLWMSSS